MTETKNKEQKENTFVLPRLQNIPTYTPSHATPSKNFGSQSARYYHNSGFYTPQKQENVREMYSSKQTFTLEDVHDTNLRKKIQEEYNKLDPEGMRGYFFLDEAQKYYLALHNQKVKQFETKKLTKISLAPEKEGIINKVFENTVKNLSRQYRLRMKQLERLAVVDEDISQERKNHSFMMAWKSENSSAAAPKITRASFINSTVRRYMVASQRTRMGLLSPRKNGASYIRNIQSYRSNLTSLKFHVHTPRGKVSRNAAFTLAHHRSEPKEKSFGAPMLSPIKQISY